MKNYYYILGIKHNATKEEIKEAYRKLSKKFHPDMNEQDHFFQERFKEIQEAYEILSDDEKRKEYDGFLYQFMKAFVDNNQAEEQNPPSDQPQEKEKPNNKNNVNNNKAKQNHTAGPSQSNAGHTIKGMIILFSIIMGIIFLFLIADQLGNNSAQKDYSNNEPKHDNTQPIDDQKTNPKEQFRIGFGYEKIKDLEKAKIYYTSSCSGNYSAACYQLGKIDNSSSALEKARKLFSRECDEGTAHACLNFGTMLGRGEGGEKDTIKGITFLDKACDLGQKLGCYSIATILDYGIGVDEDKRKARLFYNKACSMQMKEGCFQYAVMLESGAGGESKKMEAYTYYLKACDLGSTDACSKTSQQQTEEIRVSKNTYKNEISDSDWVFFYEDKQGKYFYNARTIVAKSLLTVWYKVVRANKIIKNEKITIGCSSRLIYVGYDGDVFYSHSKSIRPESSIDYLHSKICPKF